MYNIAIYRDNKLYAYVLEEFTGKRQVYLEQEVDFCLWCIHLNNEYFGFTLESNPYKYVKEKVCGLL